MWACLLHSVGAIEGPVWPREIEFTIKTWQTDEGLPQNSVSAIIQSRDGYLWLGTFNGLVRFDGVRFTTFTAARSPGLPSDNINALCEDRLGRLWIGTEGGGLVRYENHQFRGIHAPGSLAPEVISHICQDGSGTIWVGTPHGLFRVNDDQMDLVPPPPGVTGPIHALCPEQDGALWVSWGETLIRFRAGRWDPVPELIGAFRITPDLTNGVWLASDRHGLLHYADGKAIQAAELTGHNVERVLQSRDGDIWLTANRSGLIQVRNGRKSQFTAADGLLVNDLPTLFEDREGNLWIGSNGGGLHRLRKKALQTISTRNGLPHNDVVCLTRDSSENVWIGTWGEGAGIWRDGQFHRVSGALASEGLIVSFSQARSNAIWIAATDGKLYYGQNGQTTLRDVLPGQGTRTVFEDRDGGLWLGSRDFGVQHRRAGETNYFTTTNGLSHSYVTSIAQDQDGAIWVGTKGGLNRIAGREVKQFHQAHGLGAEPVHTLYPDRAGALWIGTAGGGLSRYYQGRFATVNTRDGLANDVVAQIIEDDYGYFWIGSNAGLMRVKRKNLEECLDGAVDEIQGLVLSRQEGMLNPECAGSHQPGCFKDPSGHLWFATVGGLVVVDPTRVASNPLVPPVHIESVRTEVELTPRSPSAAGDSFSYVVPAGKGRFEIDFTALSFAVPERVRFKYRLIDWDSDWVHAGTQRTAQYAKVSPGQYLFHVIACNNDGAWNETGATISIVIEPFWWQTATFKLFMAVGLAAGGLAIARSVHVRKLRRALERAERTAALLRASELGAANTQLQARTHDLEAALANVKVLRGLIPICASCKKIRDDKGFWSQVEVYVMRHSDAQFSHGVCPECAKKFLDDVEQSAPQS